MMLRRGLFRLFAVVLVVAGVVVLATMSSDDSGSKPTAAERAAAERARLRKLRVEGARIRAAARRNPTTVRERARMRLEQRPVFGRGPAGFRSRRGQGRLVARVERAITRDAIARFKAGKLDRKAFDTQCLHLVRPNTPHPPPPPIWATTAGYECTAIVDRLPAPLPTIVGFPYWVRLSFKTGRYAFCKINLLPSEHGIGDQSAFVPLRPVCDLLGKAGPA